MRNWYQRFMDLAAHIAQWSKDPSTKVGAVIVNERRIVVGMGYNGFPRGVQDTPERLNDRPVKYQFVVHAEENAVLNAAVFDLSGCTLFATKFPCNECAKVIIQRGISNIVAPAPDNGWSDSQRVADTMFNEAGICVRHWTGR